MLLPLLNGSLYIARGLGPTEKGVSLDEKIHTHTYIYIYTHTHVCTQTVTNENDKYFENL